MPRLTMALAAVAAMLLPAASPAQEMVRLWPGAAPGTESWTGGEQRLPASSPDGTPVTLLTNVTTPTLTVVRPKPGTANGTAMVVAPGGGFQILAWEEEGLTVAHWLADHGVTAFILKYRVRLRPEGPSKPGADFDKAAAQFRPMEEIAVADGREAIRRVRADAGLYKIDPHRVGMIGFSAGAMTTMGVALGADAATRPDFAASIYGAMRDQPVAADAPPLFIAAAADDALVPATQSVVIFSRWRAAHRPAELHVFEKGGHGFAMRRQHLPVDTWPTLLEAWLTAHGWLATR